MPGSLLQEYSHCSPVTAPTHAQEVAETHWIARLSSAGRIRGLGWHGGGVERGGRDRVSCLPSSPRVGGGTGSSSDSPGPYRFKMYQFKIGQRTKTEHKPFSYKRPITMTK